MQARSIIERSDAGATAEPAAGDDLRARLRGMWAAAAPRWAEHTAYVDARGAVTAEAMIERTAPQRGERVLELACGPGGLGLAAAERVALGEVVLSDVVDEMTSIAAARAAAVGLTNVKARRLDLERIEEPGSSYDVVLCREGLMLVPDPARGVREIARVLRPGGRFAIAVWGPRERNPWLGLVFDAVGSVLGAPVPPPGVPGPFSLADATALGLLLADGALTDIAVDELDVPVRAGSFDEWWDRTCALAGPLTKILASVSAEAREAMRTHARNAARTYETAHGIALPGLALLASGRRL